MQSYQGTVRLFPNWPKDKDAAFKNLRAAGAFLISASQKNGRVDEITILSEKGSDLRLIVPWGASGTIVTPQGSKEIISGSLHIKTRPGEQIKLYPRPLR
jgi:alpha-L-fucosidase 2